MKKRVIFVLMVLMIADVAMAQRWKLKRYEVMAGIGTANVFGDIGGASERDTWMGLKDYRIKDTRPSICLGLRYRISLEQAVKFNLYSGFGAGNDAGSFNDYRGYSFTTFLFEPSVQYEFHFLSEDRNTRSAAIYSRSGMINTFSMMGFYAFVGVGGVLYVPNAKYETLVTSAEREWFDNSAGFSPVIPLGLGMKYILNSEISLNLELGRRFTFTDYIDGLETYWSKSNDVYYFGTISVLYKLQTSRRGAPIFFQGSKTRKSGSRPSSGKRPLGL